MKTLLKVAALLLIGVAASLGIDSYLYNRRPAGVPRSAVFADGGKGWRYWIDCSRMPNGKDYECSFYAVPHGELVRSGVFQRSTLVTNSTEIFFDGQQLHWKNGVIMREITSTVR